MRWGLALAIVLSAQWTSAQVAGPQLPAPGDWVSVPYADALTTSRSPVAAATTETPLALQVARRDGATHIAVTSFHETRRLRVVSSAPAAARGEVAFLLTSGEGSSSPSDARVQATLRVADDRGAETLYTSLGMDEGAERRYRRLTVSLDTWAARVLLAGDYHDAQGRPWVFGADRLAATPDGTFDYRVALDPSEAGCDYFETPDRAARGGQRRTGFAWRGRSLELYRIVYDAEGPPISCAPQPFAVLTRRDAPVPADPSCGLTRLPITQVSPGQWEHLESRARTFTLRHWNYGSAPNPTAFTERGILVSRADGRRCEFDPTIYGRDLWVDRSETTIAVVASSGSSAELQFYDATTCALRGRIDVSGAEPEVGSGVVRHPGACEMADTTRGTCTPASYWRLDATCTPHRLDAMSDAWTRERFGIAFWEPSEISAPFTPNARWLGAQRR